MIDALWRRKVNPKTNTQLQTKWKTVHREKNARQKARKMCEQATYKYRKMGIMQFVAIQFVFFFVFFYFYIAFLFLCVRLCAR